MKDVLKWVIWNDITYISPCAYIQVSWRRWW